MAELVHTGAAAAASLPTPAAFDVLLGRCREAIDRAFVMADDERDSCSDWEALRGVASVLQDDDVACQEWNVMAHYAAIHVLERFGHVNASAFHESLVLPAWHIATAHALVELSRETPNLELVADLLHWD